jgi:EF hand
MFKTLCACSLLFLAQANTAQAQDFDPVAMADSDQDGKITLEEFTAFQEMGWSFFGSGAEVIKLADSPDLAKGPLRGIAPDADGVITHAAYTAGIPARFKAADTNNDGSLNAAELRAAMQPK